MTVAYTTRLDDALVFTADQFRGKFRKGTGVPYLTHLLAVAGMVGEGGGDEDQQIAALLHDWLEDIPGASQDELTRRFGPRVNRLVVAVSDCMGAPKPPWKERKEAYIAHLYDQPGEIKLISVADKLHNCRSIVVDLKTLGPRIYDHFNSGRDGALWYYESMIPAFEANGWDHWLLEQYRYEVSELLRLG